LKSDEPAYLNNYALALGKAGKAAMARGPLERAAQLDPANAGRYYFNLGALLANSGQSRAAVEAFGRIPENAPEQFKAAQAQRFRLTLGIYIDSAANQFRDLRGKLRRNVRHTEITLTIWDSALDLPGGDCDVSVIGSDTHQLVCTFATARSAGELEAGYKHLLTDVSSVVLPGWETVDSTELAAFARAIGKPEPETLPGRQFNGPHTGISIGIMKQGQSYALTLSVSNILAARR
jgi:tetratricopeptide (TPR) repeat protein